MVGYQGDKAQVGAAIFFTKKTKIFFEAISSTDWVIRKVTNVAMHGIYSPTSE